MEKIYKTTLAFAFENPKFIAVWGGKPDRILEVSMTVDDLLAIVDLANERREMQQKRGIRIVAGENRFDFEARCNKCGNPIAYFGTCRGFNFEEAKKRLEKIHTDHFCKYCGNDLRGKVHRI